MDLNHAKRVGVAAAYQGGKVLRSHFGNLSEIRKKGAIDLVTVADVESEQAVIETIRASFPDHAVLAEESGATGSASPFQWIIDPLDGTTNFAHSIPWYAVSIALSQEGRLVVGVVLNPETGELFSAVRGGGAFLNNRPISVSDTATLPDSLLVTGFPYNHQTIAGPLLQRFQNCLAVSRGVRRFGSAALDLCHVACGRFEAFWEQNLKPWDTAAGVLIAEEAGSRVTDFSDTPFTVDNPEILATNGRIHNDMLSHLKLKEME